MVELEGEPDLHQVLLAPRHPRGLAPARQGHHHPEDQDPEHAGDDDHVDQAPPCPPPPSPGEIPERPGERRFGRPRGKDNVRGAATTGRPGLATDPPGSFFPTDFDRSGGEGVHGARPRSLASFRTGGRRVGRGYRPSGRRRPRGGPDWVRLADEITAPGEFGFVFPRRQGGAAGGFVFPGPRVEGRSGFVFPRRGPGPGGRLQIRAGPGRLANPRGSCRAGPHHLSDHSPDRGASHESHPERRQGPGRRRPRLWVRLRRAARRGRGAGPALRRQDARRVGGESQALGGGRRGDRRQECRRGQGEHLSPHEEEIQGLPADREGQARRVGDAFRDRPLGPGRSREGRPVHLHGARW